MINKVSLQQFGSLQLQRISCRICRHFVDVVRGCESYDIQNAAKWFLSAEDAGVPNAQSEFFLGLMYAQGAGVQEDIAQSFAWFRKAAAHGHSRAQLIVGTRYLEEKKYDEAANWLSKAAEAGEPEAQRGLARMYTNGEGFRQDDAEAVEWATKAAEQGDTEALHTRGFIHCCRIPSTIPEDDVSSMMWFLLSERAGDGKASEFLAMLASQMTVAQMKEAERRADAWQREHPSHAEK